MFRHLGRTADRDRAGTVRSTAAELIGREQRSAVPGSDETDASARIRIYIIHTQPLMAEGLRLVLGQDPGFVVVGTQTDLVQEHVLEAGADVVLLGADLDVARGIAALRDIHVSSKVIVMAATSDLLLPSVAAGAVGYLTGSFALSELAWAIRHVFAGGVALTADQLTTLMSRVVLPPLKAAGADLCESLTARERAVLQVLATGASVDETARQLHISINTARTHVRNGMLKLKVRSKLAAVITALRAGVIEEPLQ